MKGVTTSILILISAMMLSGCATTYNLNKVVTGTNCTTRKQCIKDLSLSQPPKPDAFFLIEPKDGQNRLGIAGAHYRLFLDVCLAKSLKEAFPDSQILWGNAYSGKIDKNLPMVKISHLGDFGLTFWNGDLEFEGNVGIKNKRLTHEIKKKIEAYGSHGFLASAKSSLFEGAPSACDDFARKVNKIIMADRLPIATSDSFNLNDFEVSSDGNKCANSLYLDETNYSTLPGISLAGPVSKLLTRENVSLIPKGKDSHKACYGVHVEVKSVQFEEYDKSSTGALLLEIAGGTAGIAVGGPLGLSAMLAGEAIGETSGMVAGYAAGSAMKSFTVIVDSAVLVKHTRYTRTKKIVFELNVKDLAGKTDWKEKLAQRIPKILARQVVAEVKIGRPWPECGAARGPSGKLSEEDF